MKGILGFIALLLLASVNLLLLVAIIVNVGQMIDTGMRNGVVEVHDGKWVIILTALLLFFSWGGYRALDRYWLDRKKPR